VSNYGQGDKNRKQKYDDDDFRAVKIKADPALALWAIHFHPCHHGMT
jgi:hypothetical protein